MPGETSLIKAKCFAAGGTGRDDVPLQGSRFDAGLGNEPLQRGIRRLHGAERCLEVAQDVPIIHMQPTEMQVGELVNGAAS